MSAKFIEELRLRLPKSDARLRKHWTNRIIEEEIPLESLLSLLHGDSKVAQRFTWLIGDVVEQHPAAVAGCLPMLFSLRDSMPFPGMKRSVGKYLWHTGVPQELEAEAIPVLFEWLDDDQYRVACKHFASKALFDLAEQSRIDPRKLDKILARQSRHSNKAHASRMHKLRQRLKKFLVQ